MSSASFENPPDDELRRIYAEVRTIAVVGISSDPDKASYMVPEYLQSMGYDIIPVNPRGGTILGETVVTSLSGVGRDIDVVQVFRPGSEAPGIAREATRTGASVFWMQPGVISDEAALIARDGGMTVAMDICMMHTHLRLGLGHREEM